MSYPRVRALSSPKPWGPAWVVGRKGVAHRCEQERNGYAFSRCGILVRTTAEAGDHLEENQMRRCQHCQRLSGIKGAAKIAGNVEVSGRHNQAGAVEFDPKAQGLHVTVDLGALKMVVRLSVAECAELQETIGAVLAANGYK